MFCCRYRSAQFPNNSKTETLQSYTAACMQDRKDGWVLHLSALLLMDSLYGSAPLTRNTAGLSPMTPHTRSQLSLQRRLVTVCTCRVATLKHHRPC